MMNPRHTCQMQLTACPGPCNPRLKTHYRHHYRHHHHRHREEFYDTSSDATPTEKKFSPTRLSTLLLKSSKQNPQPFRPDVIPGTSKDNESVSETSSFARIALVKVTSVPRILQPEIVHLSQGTLKIVEPSARTKIAKIERESLVPRKIESSFLTTESVSYRQEILAIVRPPVGRVSKALNDAKNAVGRKLMNGLKPCRTSILVSCLTIVTIYAGMHVLLAVLAWQTPAHHFFVSSQICGIFALLMWRITGTILI